MPICKNCAHVDYAHVNGECVACGCIKFEPKPKREERQRTHPTGAAAGHGLPRRPRKPRTETMLEREWNVSVCHDRTSSSY